MNITSAKYLSLPNVEGNQCIEVVSDGITMHVPLDPDNRHYAAILEWVAEGNTIAEAD
jgi:hypothetical protein